MRQYLDAKQQHRDAILLFRMGDFYEMFFEDALVAARALELTLTSRSKDGNGGGIPMCGVPFHAVDGYIARLVKKGFRVAICDQVEDPRKAKGLVKREVVRVVSPGTLDRRDYLDAREPAFLMAIAPGSDGRDGHPIDASASPCSTCPPASSRPPSTPAPDGVQALADELAVLKPREIVVPGAADTGAPAPAALAALPAIATSGLPITAVDAWAFDAEAARRALLDQLRTGGLEGFGLDRHPARRRRRRRAGPLPARHAESRSRPRPVDHLPAARRCPADRSDHAEAPGDPRRARRAAATGSLLDELDRT